MKIGILGTGFGAHHANIYSKQANVNSITIFG
jgi:predicted dehydrogenase